MTNDNRLELLNTISSRFGDIHEYTLDELEGKSHQELVEIAHRDSLDKYR